MKRVFSVLLSLIMVLSLVGVMGGSALAAEAGELTIVFTGGTGNAVAGDGLSFASAAAMKESYDSDAVLLVDAGGFAPGTAAIMTAAGYDLVVPEDVIADWAITSVSMGVEGLNAGVKIEKNGVKVAFVGVVPMGGADAAAYYDTIQGAVTAARDTGAEFVIALGQVDDADALITNVAGIDAVLTYGRDAIKALPGETEEPVAEEETEEPAAEEETEEPAEEEETEESAEETEAEEPAEEETEKVAQALLASVDDGFGSIGIVTIKGNMIYGETVDQEKYEALGLEESSVIQTLEAALQTETTEEAEEPAAEEETEEPVEEGETALEEDGEAVEAEDATAAAEPVKEEAAEEETAEEAAQVEESEEAAQATEGEKATEGEETTETEEAAAAEETAEGEETTETEEAAAAEETAEGEETTKTEEAAEAEETTEAEKTTEGEETAEAEETAETEKTAETEEKAPVEPTPVADIASANDAQEPEETKQPEVVTWDGAEEKDGKASPTDYERGLQDLKIELEHPVESIEVNGTAFEAKYYTLSDGDKTVALHADVLNDWGDGNYDFTFKFSDGADAKVITVKISGEKPAAPAPTDTPKPTDTPAPSATPAPTKATTRSSSPATGDTSPIALYATILGVMVVALAVVIVLVIRKKKANR